MPRSTPSKTTKSASKAPSRSAKSAGDAISILTEDHRKVQDMFDEFEQMKSEESTDDDAKQMLVESACAELSIHTQVEEEILYPAARDAIDDMDMMDEAEVEHASAKQLISELAAMQPGDNLYDAKFTVLGEYTKHHIKEEEKEMFPKLKKADMDLDELGEEIRQRKLELREELGLPSAEGESEDVATPSKTPGHRSVH